MRFLQSGRRNLAAASCGLLLALGATSADAGLFKRENGPKQPKLNEAAVAEIQRALDESRLVDAARIIDDANLAAVKDPRLSLFGAQLNLKRGRYESALEGFRAASRENAIRPAAIEGEGITLAMLQRSDEAIISLKEAVELNPTSWRAWSALAGEWDKRRDWAQAEGAYAKALSLSKESAVVLNNRGYSRMLQGRTDDAVADLVAALKKDPALAAARTNLRLAMAMRGEYDQALAGAPMEGQAGALNNAGFAAMMRGEYDRAISLFEQAMASKGEFYARASANLQVARSLQAQGARSASR